MKLVMGPTKFNVRCPFERPSQKYGVRARLPRDEHGCMNFDVQKIIFQFLVFDKSQQIDSQLYRLLLQVKHTFPQTSNF